MDATSAKDVLLLRSGLVFLPHGGPRNALLAAVYANGLMVAPWWMRVLVKAVAWRHRIDMLQAWAMSLANDRKGKLANALMDALIDHLEFGEDKTSTDSFGGFNQTELETLSALTTAAAITQLSITKKREEA